MKRITLSVLFVTILLSCSDESEMTPTENSLTGFWNYKKVSFNGQDISSLTPGFTVSNYLDLKEDHSAGKCYMNGVWSVDSGNLKLQWTHKTSALEYKILKTSKNSLTLQIKLPQSEYGISLPQFGENEVITITEEFERLN